MKKIFKRYEALHNYIQSNAEYETLNFQYAILFRNFKKMQEIWEEYKFDNSYLDRNMKYPVIEEDDIKFIDSKYKLIDGIQWNYDYILKYNEKNHIKLEESVLQYALDNNRYRPIYTDILENNNNIFDTFFLGIQPLLNIKYLPVQEIASIQLKNQSINMIFDEVGTGKTVSALYCVRDVIDCINERDARILIICPNNKKSEWQKDIRRQLGRYAHIVNTADNESIYINDFKNIYFKENEPCIFIEGQKMSKDNSERNNEFKYNLTKWNQECKWDLIVIDEAHLSFKNYSNLRAEKAILLTATPIVVYSKGNGFNIRTLEEYRQCLCEIVGIKSDESNKLDNLFDNKKNFLEESGELITNRIFTNLFREDIGVQAKKRKIEYLECDRLEDRKAYLDIIENIKGYIARLSYEQDDEYLLEGICKFRNDIVKHGYLYTEPYVLENKKYEVMKNYLSKSNRKSYIIFCEHRFVVKNLYKKLCNDFALDMKDTIISYKLGSDEMEVFPQDNLNKEIFWDYLIYKLECDKRVILITTGATGGTGLNLGKFDGVIHYEMPFTSIELEQRFGRIDRINVGSEEDEKEMVFIINNDSNPMLRYSTMKINETCKYIPVRNTILFYPDYIKKSIKTLNIELQNCRINELEISIYRKIKNLTDDVNKIKNIDENEYKLIKEEINRINQEFRKNRQDIILNVDCEIVSEYANVYRNNKEFINEIMYKSKNFSRLLIEAENWISLIEDTDINNIEEINNGFVGLYVSDKEDEGNNEYDDEKFSNRNIIKNDMIIMEENNNIQIDLDIINSNIDKYIEKLEKIINKVKCNTYSGIFYYKKNGTRAHFCRKTVKMFREGK